MTAAPAPAAPRAPITSSRREKIMSTLALVGFVLVVVLKLLTRDIDERQAIGARSFTPRELAIRTNRAVTAAQNAVVGYVRSLAALDWPPAPGEVTALDAIYRVTLDAVHHDLDAYEIPTAAGAAELYWRLRGLVSCERQNTVVLDAISAALAKGAPSFDIRAAATAHDAKCAMVAAKYNEAWAAFGPQ